MLPNGKMKSQVMCNVNGSDKINGINGGQREKLHTHWHKNSPMSKMKSQIYVHKHINVTRGNEINAIINDGQGVIHMLPHLQKFQNLGIKQETTFSSSCLVGPTHMCWSTLLKGRHCHLVSQHMRVLSFFPSIIGHL